MSKYKKETWYEPNSLLNNEILYDGDEQNLIPGVTVFKYDSLKDMFKFENCLPEYAETAVKNTRNVLSKYGLNVDSCTCYRVKTFNVPIYAVTDGNFVVSLEEEEDCAAEIKDFDRDYPVLIEYMKNHCD